MSSRVPAPSADDSPRDAALSRAYRDAVQAQASGSEPPAALDDAIRAAARRAVHAKPRDAAHAAGGGWFGRRWQTPVALAASMVLAVGVAIKVYDTGEADVRPAELPLPSGQAGASVPAPSASSATAEPAPVPAQAPAAVDAAADANANAVGQGGGSAQSAPAAPTPAPVSPAARAAPTVTPAPAAAPAPATARPAPPARQSRGDANTRATERDAEMLRKERAQREERLADVQPGAVTATPAAPAAPAAPPAAPAAPAVPPAALPAPSAPSAPAAPPAPTVAAAPASPEKSAEQSVHADRALRERSAMKVEQAQGAIKPGVGAGLAGRIEGRMQSGAGPAAAPRPLIASAQELQSRPAEDWLVSIRELRRAGRTAEADELLAAFRKQFPDFTLPDDLR